MFRAENPLKPLLILKKSKQGQFGNGKHGRAALKTDIEEYYESVTNASFKSYMDQGPPPDHAKFLTAFVLVIHDRDSSKSPRQHLAEICRTVKRTNDASNTQELALAKQLFELGVPRDKFFEHCGFFKQDPYRLCIGEVISIASLGGVPSEMISIEQTDAEPFYPTYVLQAMPACEQELERRGEQNRHKAAVIEWRKTIFDAADGQISFTVGHSRYHKNLATRQCKTQIWCKKGYAYSTRSFLSHVPTLNSWPATSTATDSLLPRIEKFF